MSTVASAARPRPAAARPLDPRLQLWLRLASFFALAVFCAAHYSVLVADAEGGRVVGLVLVATLGGAALAATARMPGPRLVAVAVRVAIAVATLVASLVVTGLAARLLLPGHWEELGDGLDRGFTGLSAFTWPYSGDDEWVRLVLLLGMPMLVAPAAILAFWPARRFAGTLRWVALTLLLIAYGTGVAELGLGGWALRGVALLVVVAAWLWLPRLRARDTGPAALAVLACGVLALPLAAGFDRERPWLDYRSWDWFEPARAGTGFQWDHSYGPIKWSRSGVTMLQVKSAEPHYWKAETLDRFDGLRWFHTESPFRRGTNSEDIPQPVNERWIEHVSFRLRHLKTDLVIGVGTTFRVHLDKVTADEPDGTIRVVEPPLADGDSYSVDSYVPDPTAPEMRAAPPEFPLSLVSYTAFDLPRSGDSALDRGSGPSPTERALVSTSRTIVADFPGEPISADDRRRVLDSPYARVWSLAHTIAAGQPTTYDTVKAVEAYLQRGFEYSEDPPARRYPLVSFLFDDRIGYCQQFSGAMALMLRMNGIPARVAGGFAPGAYDHTAKEYRVRDLDAHSWVEVWFTGIGWVPFDPTPSLAPASSQSDSLNAASAARGAAADRGATDPSEKLTRDTAGSGGGAGGGGGSRTTLWFLLVGALVLTPVAVVALWLVGVWRQRSHPEGAIEELRTALRRLGYDSPASTTLAELERRLRVTAGPGAARYVSLLRDQRYAPPGSAAPPTARDRRALRRALTDGGGPLQHLRGLLALPPHLRADRALPGS